MAFVKCIISVRLKAIQLVVCEINLQRIFMLTNTILITFFAFDVVLDTTSLLYVFVLVQPDFLVVIISTQVERDQPIVFSDVEVVVIVVTAVVAVRD